MIDLLKRLLERAALLLVILGVALVLVGAMGQLAFGTFSIQIAGTAWKILIVVIGLAVSGLGGFLVWVESVGGKTVAERPKGPAGSEILTSGANAHANFGIDQRLKNLRTLDVLAYNLTNLLRDLREQIAEAIIKGANVRILLVDHSSIAHQMMLQHSRRPHLLMPEAIKGLENIRDIQTLLQSKAKVNGRLEVKLTSWIPSCSLILVDVNEENGIAKIGVNPPALRCRTGRVSLTLTRKEHLEYLNHFINSFDLLWQEESKPWDGTLPEDITQYKADHLP